MPSELNTFQSNIDQVTVTLTSTRGIVETGIEALEIAESALEALDEIDTNASALKSIASGLETAVQLVSRLGGAFGSITKNLKKAIDLVEDRAAEVEQAAKNAKPVESRFEDILNAVKAGGVTLKAQLLLIDEEVQQLGSITAGLDDAVSVVDNTDGMDIPTEFNAAIAAANATAAGINQSYQPVIDAINTIENVRTTVANVLNAVIAPGRDVADALYAIKTTVDGLSFLSGPLGVVQDILSPISWALDAIDFIYNATIGVVVNPIIDAIGIGDFFNDFMASIGFDLDALTENVLPDVAIFEGFTDPLDDLFDELDIGLLDDLEGALEDLADQIIGTGLLGPVNNAPTTASDLVIGDDDNPPGDETGTALDALSGDDLVSGGLGDDTLTGGAGNDLIIGGAGDDIIDGGTGFDGAVFFGLFQEFRISYDANDDLIVTHVGFDGGGWQGTDRVTNVDKIIFSDQTFDFSDFENFQYSNSTPTQSDTLEGDVGGIDTADYLFGNVGRDFIFGYDENDYLAGRAGQDDLFGGAGDDILDGGDIGNTYFGGAGNDTVTYEGVDGDPNGVNTIYLAMLNDPSRTPFGPANEQFDQVENITGAPGLDTWIWGDGDDNVLTGGDTDRINGFGGDDTIIGGPGMDQLVGGMGDDYVDAGGFLNRIIAGPGNDTYVSTTGLTDVWYGGEDGGGEPDDTYSFAPIQSSEVAEGVSGFSRLAVLGFVQEDVPILIPSRIVADLGAGTVQKFNGSDASMGTDTLIGVSVVTGSQGDDLLTGKNGFHFVGGGDGDDHFIGVDQSVQAVEDFTVEALARYGGDDGDDLFEPAFGIYGIVGGFGSDTLRITKDGYIEFSGNGTGFSDAGFDTVDLSGSARAWDFYANDDETAEGFTPGDTRDPVTGEYADVMDIQVLTTEHIIGSQFDDILRTNSLTEFDHDTRSIDGGGGNDQLFSLSPTFSQSTQSHTLRGGEGDDSLFGGLGRDLMFGGTGNDKFWDVIGQPSTVAKRVSDFNGEGGNDTFYFTTSNVYFNATVTSGVGHTVDGGDGFDVVDYTQYANALNLVMNAGNFSNIEGARGSQFADTIQGTDDVNSIAGQDGNDLLRGEGGDDIIYTGRGNDTAFGGAGNDVIFAAEGTNVIRGGEGNDVLSFDAYQTGEERQQTPGWTPEETQGSVTVDLQDGGASFVPQGATTSTLSNVSGVENITGGWDSDQLFGNGSDNIINGGRQDAGDSLVGRHGDDILFGGGGDDTLYGDLITGGAQTGFTDGHAVSLNAGDETQHAAVLDSYALPTEAVTVELLFRANDGALPSSFMSFFSYAAGSPVDQEEFLIFGYTQIFGGVLGVRINGTNILSNIQTSTILDGDIHRLSASYDGATGSVVLYLNGLTIASGLTGSGGLAPNGRVVIGQDQDADGIFQPEKTMKGEVADIRVWDGVRSASEVNALAQVDALDANAHPDLVGNWVPDAAQPGVIEDVIAGADLNLLGASGFTSFADGDDTLDGGAGADMLFGGEGRDLANYSGSDTRVEIDLAAGTGNSGHATGDILDSIEDITGSAFNDLILGDAVANTLDGGAARDNMNGRAGDDLLIGGTGDDLISGGNGNDTLEGGPDALAQPDSPEDPLTDNDVLRGNGGHDHIVAGDGMDTAFGGTGEDVIAGGLGNDSLLGQGNNDTIHGDAGHDTLRGGSGHDSIEGGGGNDLLYGNGNNDTLIGGQGDDFLQGAAGADSLMGEAGDDTLAGGNAGDTLDGGSGDDLLNGGANADRLLFALGSGSDTIAGFEDDIDTIEITAALAGGQTVAELLADVSITSQIGASVVMDFGGGDVLRINNVGVSDLADDMVIV